MQRDLSVSDPFAARHIGPSSDDQRAMLATLGYETLDDLIKAALPAEIPDGSHAAQSLAKLPPPGPRPRPWPTSAGWPLATRCGYR